MFAVRILPLVIGVTVLLGTGQRVLDRMRLTDRQALLILAAMFAAGFLPDFEIGRVTVNLGGGVIPVLICAFLFVKAEAHERVRAVSASLAAMGVVLALGRFFPDEPESMPFDVNYLYGISAGVLAALAGRSRRSAFIAGVLGVVLADCAEGIAAWLSDYGQKIHIGTGGILDTAVLSGLGAVLTAELIGEFRERLMRGARKDGRSFKKGEIVGGDGK